MNFQLGCAIWAYKPWVGELYPAGSRATEFLSLYSQRFTTVEGNTTFYSTPDEATIARWVAETPAGFEFCLKLPRSVTHQGALTPMIPAALHFLDHMSQLGDRLGVCFAQLPPSYSPRQFSDLTAFLQAWHYDKSRLALEVRHLDWFKQPHASQLNELLQQHGVGRVLLDTRPIYDCPDDPQLKSERKKPRLPLQKVMTADFGLIRYISHPDRALNSRFLLEWVEQVAEWLQQGKQLYFFVHCPVEERSPANARYVQQLLEQQGIPMATPVWEIDVAPTQLSLF
ncbi:MAG: DUF72 domain-containing protein [Leptolyngbyaceae cyanobacterium SL_7_1]|nr:DUF72 domain-containing protein [Leptolyngbyaceae cyanobacterium SL_7_1]